MEEKELLNIVDLISRTRDEYNEIIDHLKSSKEEQKKYEACKLLAEYDTKQINDTFEKQKTRIQELVKSKALSNNEYNEQYKTFINNLLEKLKNKCNKILESSSNIFFNNFNTKSSQMIELIEVMSNEVSCKIFEYFKYGNKNYILFGKNGAGKTSLLNKLSKEVLNTNAIVIPATRDIKYNENFPYYKKDISLENAIKSDSNGKSLFFLAQCILSKENGQHRLRMDSKITINQIATDIFEELGIDRRLMIDSNGGLFLYNENVSSYSLLSASDGERTTIYFIFVTLLAPLNSYIFIDEPENHLNGALMRKLFATLEKHRPDIRFIFATHNIPFIECQKNVELVYLEKNDEHNHWSFKKYEDYSELPLDLLLNIEGTNDNIIFCEGEDRNSYDCKLYEVLYPEYQVIASNGCQNVISQTKSFNKFSRELRRVGFGIIDNDFHDAAYIEKLSKSKITVLNVNEVENLFLLENCLQKIKEFMSLDKSLEEIQEEIFYKVSVKINGIKKDYATKLFRTIQQSNKIEDIHKLEECIKKLNEANLVEFSKKYSDFEMKISKAIEDKDYDILMKLVPGKSLINDVAKIFGLLNGENYKTQLINLIRQDKNLIQSLKTNIDLKI